MDRYSRNEKTLTPEQNKSLRSKRVCVVGCGGLGGLVIELLGRAGVLNMTVIDGDVFDETNLNRQILATTETLGTSKVVAAADRMKRVNPYVRVRAVNAMLTEENAKELLRGHDLVVDALDSIPTRLLVEREAHALGIPLVHGAIAGWYGQVGVSFPGDYLLSRLYRTGQDKGIEKETGNPPFTPALIAAMEVCEAIKVLTGNPNVLRHRLAYVDLLYSDMTLIEL